MSYGLPRLQEMSRRQNLKSLATSRRDSKPNDHLSAFADIVAAAIALVADQRVPFYANLFNQTRTEMVMEDLKWVLIGAGLRAHDRNKGPYFVGRFTSTGFRKEFQEPPDRPGEAVPNQVAHAMAGLYIGSQLGPLVAGYAMFRENAKEDLALYRATFALGTGLSDTHLGLLPGQIRWALG